MAYHYLVGLPYTEIAAIVGGSTDAARRAAADGIKTLRSTYPSRTERGVSDDDDRIRPRPGDLFAALPVEDPAAQARLHERLVDGRERDGLLDVAYRTLDTPVGTLLLAATEQGLVRVAFDSSTGTTTPC